MTASIDGSEEVWSAILASILTHIAVFVPLMFLTGISSVMFVQLSIVVCFSLAMSLFVAVTLVPVLCSRLLVLPAPADQRKGISGWLYTVSDKWLKGMDDGYRRLIHLALNHRPTVVAAAAASVVAAVLILPTIPSEFSTQTDEGQVSVQAELPIGTRIERTDAVLARLEQTIPQLVPETESIIASAAGGGNQGQNFGGQTNRGNVNIFLVPKDERTRSSDQIAIDLRNQLRGIPGVVIRANASGGNNQINRFLSGGDQGGGRLSLEIRGEDLKDARDLALRAKDMLDGVPGIADARLGRDEGRPELAVHVDRPKAALLGLTSTGVANTIRTNVAGTQAALFREHGNEYPIIVRLQESDRQQVSDVQDVLISSGSGQVLQAKNLMTVDNETGPVQIDRKNQQRITTVSAEPEITLSDAVKAVQDAAPAAGDAEGFQRRLRRGSRGTGQGVQPAADGADPGAGAGLRGDGVPVRVAARSVHHHVLGADGRHRRRARAQADRHRVQHAGLHRHHHAGRHRRQQRHPAGRLHQRAAPPRRAAAARSGRARRPHAAAADSDDVDRHHARPGADVAGDRRRQRAAGAARARRHRRAVDVAGHHAGPGADGLHDFRRGVERPVAASTRRTEAAAQS